MPDMGGLGHERAHPVQFRRPVGEPPQEARHDQKQGRGRDVLVGGDDLDLQRRLGVADAVAEEHRAIDSENRGDDDHDRHKPMKSLCRGRIRPNRFEHGTAPEKDGAAGFPGVGLQLLMAAVTERGIGAVPAAAQIGGAVRFGGKGPRGVFAPLVAAVTERLPGAFAAGAPVIGLPRFQFDGKRGFLRDDGRHDGFLPWGEAIAGQKPKPHLEEGTIRPILDTPLPEAKQSHLGRATPPARRYV